MTTAYMQTHHKVLKVQYEGMRELCKDMSQATYKLFCHILVCTLLKLKEEEEEGEEQYVPVSYELIRKSAYGAKWEELANQGLIKDKDHNRHAGLSKEYRASNKVLDLFFELSETPDYKSAVKVNLFTGNVSNKKIKNILTDETGHPEPPLIQAAMDMFAENKCLYNKYAIEEHLFKATNLFTEKQKQLKVSPSINLEALVNKLELRHRNDEVCYKVIQDQDSEDKGDGICVFTPAYHGISTGRIQHNKGGLQTCSREMKQAAYSNIPGLRNYDLKGSQSNIAIQLMEEAGVDTSWLCTYRDTANSKHIYAEEAGLTVDNWKKCVLAMLMGATLPANTNNFKKRKNSILKVIEKQANGDPDEVLRLNKSLNKVLGGLDKSIKQWHNWLMNTYIPANQKKGGQANKYYIQNKTGKRKCVTDLPKLDWEAKSEVAAFLLQGQEATFIHKLTIISKQYGYKPMANEHDGLITIGDIPQEAIEEAASFSGLKYAVIEDKPFV